MEICWAASRKRPQRGLLTPPRQKEVVQLAQQVTGGGNFHANHSRWNRPIGMSGVHAK